MKSLYRSFQALIKTALRCFHQLAGWLSSYLPKDDEASQMRDQSFLPPYSLFVAGLYLLAGIHWLWQRLHPPALVALNITFGLAKAKVLSAVCELQLADALAGGPESAEDLAQRLGLHAQRLERLLNAAVSMGVFARGGKPRTFRNNRVSAVLRSDHPNSARDIVLTLDGTMTPGIGQLAWGVRTGGRMFERTMGGQDMWTWLAADPQRLQMFNRGMAETDRAVSSCMLEDYDWGQYKRVLDIGGCYGSFLKGQLERWPGPAGVLFDLPNVMAEAEEKWRQYDSRLRSRVKLASGSFFEAETLPPGQHGDAFFLRNVLHDWPDEKALQILSNCRKALGHAQAKVVLIEIMDRGFPYSSVLNTAMADVHMLAGLDGAERSAEQWRRLLPQAGFSLGKITPTRSPFCIIECLPV